ncbi:excinuclease ABC subunit C [Boudabousia tangfeifanii]|uniref:UvrABC system protein C n=1 Tax=Boudabousia tangfeifanii TaxID=1912795 RepID=A0A1D9MK95_9ACTO|nr:excinuclease ABC subunit UvrC [Boudabousia tangfeifanii]AOZ72590.1 excinuclease ABC subunit C [Boudabousia tangfeifanii]
MADPQSYRPKTGDIPTSPGVYRFRDPEGRVIYVGKAKNLRNRLTSYFQDPSKLHERTQKMVHTASSVQWTVVGSELEALTLEYSWIKEFSPRFNVMYNRNDMSFPYLAVTMNEVYPRAMVMRGNRKPEVQYFGPFPQPWTIRETLEQLLKIFPVRTCSKNVFASAKRRNRACLLGHIGKCSAPCVGWISVEEHRELANQLCRFMAGSTGPVIRDLTKQMNAAAEDLEYEKAAKLRDQIVALKTVVEKNAVVLADGTDVDVIGLCEDELEIGVYVLNVRGGRIRGVRGWVVNPPAADATGQVITSTLEYLYGELPIVAASPKQRRLIEQPRSVDDVAHLSTSQIPGEILVTEKFAGQEAMSQWLRERRGSKVTITVPQRGDKKALLETANQNAADTLRLHKTKRIADLTQRSLALEGLAELLDLERPPLRIECFDVSHLQGTNQVASMVVFEDGAPRKSEYRKFNVRGQNGEGGLDDTAAMKEVLTRRFSRLLTEGAALTSSPSVKADKPDLGQLDTKETHQSNSSQGLAESAHTSSQNQLVSGPVSPENANSDLIDPETGRPKKFAYKPDLLVIDGGLPQVNAAAEVLAELNVDLPVIGLAKRLEEVWMPHTPFPIIFPRQSPALYLLQHLRDESHRKAITHHRQKRSKSLTRSKLDEIPGLGPARQKILLSHFGTIKAIKAAKVEDIAALKGISNNLAQTIHLALTEGKPND